MAVKILIALSIISLVAFIVHTVLRIFITAKLWGRWKGHLDDIGIEVVSSEEVIKDYDSETAEMVAKLEEHFNGGPKVVQLPKSNKPKASKSATAGEK